MGVQVGVGVGVMRAGRVGVVRVGVRAGVCVEVAKERRERAA